MRHILPKDAANMYALNSDPEVLRHTGDSNFVSLAASEQFIRDYPDYRVNGFGRWAVLRIEDQALLGWCGLKRHPGGMVDLGYRFFQRYWGRGYATEASLACLQWGFEVAGLEEVVGRVAKANTASIRVLEKVGMTFWREEPCEGIQESLIYRIRKG